MKIITFSKPLVQKQCYEVYLRSPGWLQFLVSYSHRINLSFICRKYFRKGTELPNEGSVVPGLNGIIPDNRIVGGAETTIEYFPWQVSMTYNKYHRCGGSIISHRHVLTAAHCTHRINAAAVNIRAGSSSSHNGGVLIAVNRIFQHPSYNNQANDFDLSVLKLSLPLTYGRNIKPIELPDYMETILPGIRTWVTGWGDNKESGGIRPTQLHYTTVPIVDNRVCANAYARQTHISNSMICAGYYKIGGRDACQGDSGGPLVANNKLYGIVSFGVGCARPAYPGVYTRVSFFRKWIDDIMEQN